MDLKKRANETEVEQINETLEWLMSGVDLESRRIEIRGEVNETMASIIIRALLKMSEKSLDPIELYLSSPGGDAYEGMAIFDSIIACPCDVHIIGSGKIMSAAFIIFLAGDVRIAAPHTTFMMHSVSYGVEGNVKSHEVQVNEGKRINNVFLDIMANRTNRNKKYWYRTILNLDKYFTVAEATELGIIKNVPNKINAIKKGAKNGTRKKIR